MGHYSLFKLCILYTRSINRMKKILFSIILLTGISGSHVFACLNGEHYILADGSTLFMDEEEGYSVPRGHTFYDAEMDRALHNLDSLWKQTRDADYLSDYALILIIKKRYAEAEEIYLQIEKDFPGRYSTASNLGTLYELIGQNEKALQWISKALEIDPKSHYGSEWIHVNILKAKLKGDDALNASFLLGTDFGNYNAPSSKLSHQELVDLQLALYYQLNERMSFVLPPDKIVGVLLASLADVLWLNGEQKNAAIVYSKSLDYEPGARLVNERLERAQGSKLELRPGSRVEQTNYWALIGGVGAFIVLATFVFIRHRTS